MGFAEAQLAMKLAEPFNPRPYQERSIHWILKHPNCGLFLHPGMGKTAVTLAAFKVLKKNKVVHKMLVIAPLRVCHLVWPAEMKKWSMFNDFTYTVLHGPNKDENLKKDVDIYIINPEGLKWLFSHRNHPFGYNCMLTVDESTMFKNYSSKRFKLLKKHLTKFKKRLILTGTPAPRSLENLWSQMFIIDQGERLGRYITRFRNNYFYPSGYMGYQYTLRDGAENEIYGLIEDVTLSIDRSELDMPPLVKNMIDVELPISARRTYEELKREYVTALEDGSMTIADNGAAMAGKLRQIANGSVYNTSGDASRVHDEKVNAIKELHQSLSGNPLLVLYEFRHDLDALKEAFPNARHIGGGVSVRESNDIQDKWNRGELDILFLHPQSAGHGLNLQSGGCTDVAFFSIITDHELHEQAYQRVWRQGVWGDVTVHYINAVNTIDQHSYNILETKEAVQNALLGALTGDYDESISGGSMVY